MGRSSVQSIMQRRVEKLAYRKKARQMPAPKRRRRPDRQASGYDVSSQAAGPASRTSRGGRRAESPQRGCARQGACTRTDPFNVSIPPPPHVETPGANLAGSRLSPPYSRSEGYSSLIIGPRRAWPNDAIVPKSQKYRLLLGPKQPSLHILLSLIWQWDFDESVARRSDRNGKTRLPTGLIGWAARTRLLTDTAITVG
ncbi:unnamed protein product [Protopolystoma xenopodis]|uniref:Uncharacterized protein n=1 Tax=Protopolystoma xenopodis TaxID=117903 RepID=A0A3S5C903_9PLAT|nr:unnamed protein product [Protopolystoma xenopodis]